MITTEIDDFLNFFYASKDVGLDSEALEDKIYGYYSKVTQTKERINSESITVRKNLTFDRAWYYDMKFDSLFQSTGKYLLTKGGDCVSVAPTEFIEDNDLSNGYGNDGKCYVKLQIYQFFTLGAWNWVCGQNYFGSHNTLRLYFSFIKKEKAQILKFIKYLKEVLDQKEIPFRIKFENEISYRNENAVLYFQRSDYYPVFVVTTSVYCKFSEIFRDSKMPFVKKFSEYPGVYFAESPTTTTSSFGTFLSRVFCKILFGKDKMESNEFIDGLKKEGLMHDKLYLNPNTNFPYSFEPFESKSVPNSNLAIDYDLLRFDVNMLVASKIVNIIIRNLYVILDETSKTQVGIFEWEKHEDETIFLYAPDNVLLEIFENLVRYNSALEKKYNVSDEYATIFLSKVFQSSPNAILENIKDDLGMQYVTGGDFDNPDSINVLGNTDTFDKDSEDLIKKIAKNLEERGVVSYLPDDEFVCSYDNKGYNYILKNLLIKIEMNLYLPYNSTKPHLQDS